MPERTWTIRSTDDLGHAVADIRSATGKTQADLAADTGLTRAYVAKIETGRTSPLLDHLLRALRRLGATVTVTFDEPDPAGDRGAGRAGKAVD
ncbi:MAG: helix-turn-helix transcriptional regulator [Iamia sp.]